MTREGGGKARQLTGRTFSSLRARNYRLYFFGQLVSLTGTWMQTTAQAWLVINNLHGSGVDLGVMVALQFLPMLLFGVWGGVIADRVDKRKMLVATQTGAAVLASVLFVLTATDVIQIWMVYLVAFGLGLVTVIDNPTRQAFVIEMVGPADVPNAVGLNSGVFNSARLVGPLAAAAVIKVIGIAPAFLANAVSYVAVIGGLLAMRPAELVRHAPVARAKGQIREGLRYVLETPTLRATLVFVTVLATFGFNYVVVLPLLAKFTFHGDAGLFGLFTAMMAGGSIAGALVAATRAAPTRRLLFASAGAFAVAALAATLAPTSFTESLMLIAVGATLITFVATANSSLQLTARPEMRGRVMALYALLFLGTNPIGAPVAGWVSQHFGARAGIGLGAIAAPVGALLALAASYCRGERRLAPDALRARPEEAEPADEEFQLERAAS